jgi:hypothetical protein
MRFMTGINLFIDSPRMFQRYRAGGCEYGLTATYLACVTTIHGMSLALVDLSQMSNDFHQSFDSALG